MLLFLLSLFFLDILLGTLYNRSPQTSSLNDMHFQIMETKTWFLFPEDQQRVGIPENGWLGRSDQKGLPFWGKFGLIFQGGCFALLVSGCVLVTDVDSHLKTRSRQVYKGYTTRLSIGPVFFLLSYAPRSWLEIQYSLESFIELPRSPSLVFGRSCRSPFVASRRKKNRCFVFFFRRFLRQNAFCWKNKESHFSNTQCMVQQKNDRHLGSFWGKRR